MIEVDCGGGGYSMSDISAIPFLAPWLCRGVCIAWLCYDDGGGASWYSFRGGATERGNEGRTESRTERGGLYLGLCVLHDPCCTHNLALIFYRFHFRSEPGVYTPWL